MILLQYAAEARTEAINIPRPGAAARAMVIVAGAGVCLTASTWRKPLRPQNSPRRRVATPASLDGLERFRRRTRRRVRRQ